MKPNEPVVFASPQSLRFLPSSSKRRRRGSVSSMTCSGFLGKGPGLGRFLLRFFVCVFHVFWLFLHVLLPVRWYETGLAFCFRGCWQFWHLTRLYMFHDICSCPSTETPFLALDLNFFFIKLLFQEDIQETACSTKLLSLTHSRSHDLPKGPQRRFAGA